MLTHPRQMISNRQQSLSLHNTEAIVYMLPVSGTALTAAAGIALCLFRNFSLLLTPSPKAACAHTDPPGACPRRYVAASCQMGIIRLWSLEDVYKGATTAASEAGAASASAQDSEAQSTGTAEAWDSGLEVTQGERWRHG